jgi:hypothetical protein
LPSGKFTAPVTGKYFFSFIAKGFFFKFCNYTLLSYHTLFKRK